MAHSAVSDVNVGFVHTTTGTLFSRSMQYLQVMVATNVAFAKACWSLASGSPTVIRTCPVHEPGPQTK